MGRTITSGACFELKRHEFNVRDKKHKHITVHEGLK